ncbi:MAG: hypothetical protein NZZ41_01745 [Candidatus Dojkabacteria bacterium]|nr:hypothetical protein [Candidatus Dojkabacteria bacterium]
MKCPYCGSKHLQKTFNFNEYNCILCDSYFRKTSDGKLHIFQDGSWKKFCHSITENVKKYISDANIINTVHNLDINFSKSGPEYIDVLIDEYKKLATMVLNEVKIGIRPVHNFEVIYKQLKTLVECAKSLYNRQEELNIKIKLNEEIDNFTDNSVINSPQKLEDANVLANEVLDYLQNTKKEINDVNIIQYIYKNHYSKKDLIPTVLNIIKQDTLENYGVEDTTEDDIKLENISEAIIFEDENMTNKNEQNENTDEDSSNEEMERPDVEKDSDDSSDISTDETSTEENTNLKDIKNDINLIKNKLNKILDKIDASEEETPEEETPEEETSEEETSEEVEENTDENTNETVGEDFEQNEQNIKESQEKNKKKLVANRTGYKLKIDNRKANTKDPHQTDMTAEEEDQEIPYTERERTRMKKMGLNTENDISNGILKKKEKLESKMYSIGDNVFVEGHKDIWKIKEIKGNIFTLEKNKLSMKININETKIRHVDRNLEWQSESKALNNLRKKWLIHQNMYLKEQGENMRITGIVGLGGGNRLGGEKFNSTNPLPDYNPEEGEYYQPDYTPPEKIYAYIKDNNLQKINRESAKAELLSKFVNPEAEIDKILDDAILSEDPRQTDSIDSSYGYIKPNENELDLKYKLKNNWNEIQQIQNNNLATNSFSRKYFPKLEVKPYETQEDTILNDLDKSYKNILKDI